MEDFETTHSDQPYAAISALLLRSRSTLFSQHEADVASMGEDGVACPPDKFPEDADKTNVATGSLAREKPKDQLKSVESDSSTNTSPRAVQLLLLFAISSKFSVDQLDLKDAFLHANLPEWDHG